MAIVELPPRGRYLAAEVGRLAGVSGNTIGQWARRGYIRSSHSDGTPRVYSYQDIGEAMVVHALLEHDIAHAEILDTIRSLRVQHGHSWPLSHADLNVAGTPTDEGLYHRAHHHLAVPSPDGGFVRPADGQRTMLSESDLIAIAADLSHGGWAAREGNLRHIEVDPDRLSGRPVIRGTRVPAEDIARLALGHDMKAARHYGVTDEQIADAVSWWRRTTSYEAA